MLVNEMKGGGPSEKGNIKVKVLMAVPGYKKRVVHIRFNGHRLIGQKKDEETIGTEGASI